jgi:hypothetical protein
MAKRVTESLVDDIDGSAASTTIRFAVDGTEYEMDLNDRNAEEFHEHMAPYISAARRVGGGRQSRGARSGVSRSTSTSSNGSSPDPKACAPGPSPTASRSASGVASRRR